MASPERPEGRGVFAAFLAQFGDGAVGGSEVSDGPAATAEEKRTSAQTKHSRLSAPLCTASRPANLRVWRASVRDARNR